MWRNHPDFPNYFIEDVGTVYSSITKKNLKPACNKSGHQFVYLGRGNKRYLHRLVLEAFIGPCPKGLEGLHEDDDPANNRLVNLRWGTRSDNMKATLRAHPGLRSRQTKKQWENRRVQAHRI